MSPFFFGYINPAIPTDLETTYLSWFVVGVAVWLLVINITSRFTVKVPLFIHHFSRWYEQLCSVQEFKANRSAPYLLIALITFLVFALKVPASSITLPLQVGEYICPTWFQNCYQFYFFSEQGYHIWSIVLVVLLSGALTAVVTRRFVLGHMLLLVPAIWHILLVGLFTHNDFYYGHVMLYVALFSGICLFLPNKSTTLGWVLILTYVLSLGSKMTDSWLQGNVFKALDLGLPLIGNQFSTTAALMVIILQGVVVWLLLCKKPLRYGAVGALFIFHLYSVPLIQYFFPAVAIILLFILFLGYESPIRWPTKRLHQSIIIGITVLLLLGQSVSLSIPGDSRLTNEGVRFGLHMFKSLSWCYVTTSLQYEDGTRIHSLWQEERMGYCNPYHQWYVVNQQCLYTPLEEAVLTIDIAINQEPYRRVVDTVAACSVNYSPIRHNEWIQINREALEVIKYETLRKQTIL